MRVDESGDDHLPRNVDGLRMLGQHPLSDGADVHNLAIGDDQHAGVVNGAGRSKNPRSLQDEHGAGRLDRRVRRDRCCRRRLLAFLRGGFFLRRLLTTGFGAAGGMIVRSQRQGADCDEGENRAKQPATHEESSKSAWAKFMQFPSMRHEPRPLQLELQSCLGKIHATPEYAARAEAFATRGVRGTEARNQPVEPGQRSIRGSALGWLAALNRFWILDCRFSIKSSCDCLRLESHPHFTSSRPSRPVGTRLLLEDSLSAVRRVSGGPASAAPLGVARASTRGCAGRSDRRVTAPPVRRSLRNHMRTKKNTGVRKMPNRVTPIMPLNTAVPSDWRISAPAPWPPPAERRRR